MNVAKVACLFLFLATIPTPLLHSQTAGSQAAATFSLTPPPATAPPSITLQKEVREVNLVFTVKDRKGKFINDLTASDLAIVDNGNRQTRVTYFQSQTNLPLRVALVLDTSASVTNRISEERADVRSFLRSVIRSPDSLGLFVFNEKVKALGFTFNKWKEISRQIKHLKPGGETALYDAVITASQWLAHDRQPSRRVIVLITDGQENGSKATLEQSISEALKAEAAIYGLNVGLEDHSATAAFGASTLKKLADATGGEYLRADSDGYVGSAFNKIQRELRSQYVIAYRPSNLADQIFHWVHVTAPKAFVVRCRSGYYVR